MPQVQTPPLRATGSNQLFKRDEGIFVREIKFRVYDKHTGFMHICGTDSHDEIYFEPSGIASYYNLQNGEGSGEGGAYELMQYTGFKDVDGKEIYEVDILRIYDEEDNEDFSWVDDVSFLCGGFFSGDEDLVGNIHFRARVIGNIYENPELIQQ